jgi:competence protein ComEC
MHTGSARERARTWPQARAAAGYFGLRDFDQLARRVGNAFRAAVAAETASGRLVPWLPVAFGLGIAFYFTAEHEPSWIAAALLSAVTALTAYSARRRPFAFAAAVLAAAGALGFTIATLRSALIAHPVLERPLYGASIAGFVEVREERERTDRIALKVVSIVCGSRSGAGWRPQSAPMSSSKRDRSASNCQQRP